MKLIYRGYTFYVSMHLTQPYRKPKALNWRYQIPGECYGDDISSPSSHQPLRVVNWRWRV